MSDHQSKQLQLQDIDSETIILTMTSRHKDIILMQDASLDDRVFTLKEYLEEEGDVEDPFGGSIKTYQTCADTIHALVQKLMKKLNY